MGLSTVIAEELKELNESQLELVHKLVKTFKIIKAASPAKKSISLEEVWRITSKSREPWSRTDDRDKG